MKRIVILCLCFTFMGILFFITTSVFAQSGKSPCVVTRVGSPDTSPSPPPDCGEDTQQRPSDTPSSGIFGFPLLQGPGVLTSINTEMASYSNGHENCMQGACHPEHAGLDLMTSAGEEVIAVADGQVILSEDPGTCPSIEWGCRVEVLHDDGKMISAYVHIDPTVEVNTIVKKGDRVGYVHDWPNYGASMDHLHFEFRDERGYNVNPRNYYEELNRFPPSTGYIPTVRDYTAQRGLPWIDDNKEFGETFLNHPPCQGGGECWAH